MDSEKIYQFDKETKEFTGQYEREINPKLQIDLETRTRIPVLPPKEGFARVFNSEKEAWNYAEDHRGKPQYSTADKTESQIDYLGMVKKGFTLDKPSPFDDWINGAWVTDIEAKNKAEYAQNLALAENEYAARMDSANKDIFALERGVKRNLATPEEVKRYEALQDYTFLLTRVKTADWPLMIDWPIYPELSQE